MDIVYSIYIHNDDGVVYKLQLVRSHLIIYYCVQPIVTAGFTVVIY